VTPVGTEPPRELRVSREELARMTDLRPTTLAALEAAGLIAAHPHHGMYGEDAVQIGRAAARLEAFGIEPRHLRAFKTAGGVSARAWVSRINRRGARIERRG